MKKLHTLLDEQDFVLNAQYFEEGQQPTNAVEELVTENFLKPKFDFTNRVFFEGATTEEIAEANKPIVPSIITARQLRLQLVLNGFNLNTIDLIIDSLPEPNKSIARVSWEYATTFEREHQMLSLIAQQLGIIETELDTIFINAEKL